jgi:hypothetical protein
MNRTRKDTKNQQGPVDAGEESMQIPGVNGKNKYQVLVLRSGSALNDLSIEVLRSGSRL